MQFGDDKITEWRIKLEMELELSLFYFFGKRVKIFICKNKLSLLKFPAPPYRSFLLSRTGILLRKHVTWTEAKKFTMKAFITFFSGYLRILKMEWYVSA